MSFAKVDPRNVDTLRALYKSEEVSGVIRRQPGYRFHYLLESVEHAGEIRSMTAWGSRQDAEAYEASGVYRELVRKVEPMLTMPPQVNSYEVHE